jgi:hypothetical protein
MKNKETLEEVAEIFVNNRFSKQISGDKTYPDIYASKEAIVESHILFSKWQQERMYSEEEAKEFFIEGYKQRAEKSNLIFDNASRMYATHLFEQFKKNNIMKEKARPYSAEQYQKDSIDLSSDGGVIPTQEQICTGCGTLKSKELGKNHLGEDFLACCPDSSFVDFIAPETTKTSHTDVLKKVEWIAMMHKQNLNGRETEDELFEAGILAGIEESYMEEEVYKMINDFAFDWNYNYRGELNTKEYLVEWFAKNKKQ